MTTLRAMLWDVDGTIAETERDAHRIAFNEAFEFHGFPWRWSVARYGELLAVSGGRERILFDWATNPEAPPVSERESLAKTLHATKTARYAALLAGGSVPLRPGVRDLFEECRAHNVRLAIVTTTTTANMGVLLAPHLGLGWSDWFAALVCGEDVTRKKPDPEAYLRALAMLQLESGDVVAIEDSPAGVAAARGAHVPVIVTRSVYFADAPMPGAIAVGPGFGTREGWTPPLRHTVASEESSRVRLDDIREWVSHPRTSGDVTPNDATSISGGP